MPGTTAIFSGWESRNTLLCIINTYAVVLIGKWKGKDAQRLTYLTLKTNL